MPPCRNKLLHQELKESFWYFATLQQTGNVTQKSSKLKQLFRSNEDRVVSILKFLSIFRGSDVGSPCCHHNAPRVYRRRYVVPILVSPPTHVPPVPSDSSSPQFPSILREPSPLETTSLAGSPTLPSWLPTTHPQPQAASP